MGLQVEVMVGPQIRESPVDGGVEPCGNQCVLKVGAFRGVVVDIVGGYHGDADITGGPDQLPVAVGVPMQEVLL